MKENSGIVVRDDPFDEENLIERFLHLNCPDFFKTNKYR